MPEMRIRIRAWIRRACIFLIPAVLLSGLFVQSVCSVKLQYVEKTVLKDGKLYGIDINDREFLCFRSDPDGKNAEIVRAESREEIPWNLDQGSVFPEKEVSPGVRWYVDKTGSVWEKNKTGEAQCLLDLKSLNGKNAAYSFGKDGLYFYHIQAGCRYRIPYDSKKMEPVKDKGWEAYRSLGYIYGMEEMEDGAWTASFYQADGRLLPAVPALGDGVISSISIPQKTAFIYWAIYAALILGGELMIFLVFYLVQRIFHGVFPTIFQIIMLTVPVLGAGFLLLHNQVNHIFIRHTEEKEKTSLYYGAASLSSQLDAKELGKDDPDQKCIYETLYDFIMGRVPAETIVRGDGTRITGGEERYSDFRIFKVRNGDFYEIEEDGINYAPGNYRLGPVEKGRLARCAFDKFPLAAVEQNPYDGERLVLYYPVLDMDENVTGIVKGAYPAYYIESQAQRSSRYILEKIGLFLAVILAALTVSSYLSLRPLGKLKQAVMAVSRGERHVHVQVTGRGEIGEMIHVFNRMDDNLEARWEEMKRLKDAYEPYVPEELTALFGKPDIRSIHPGDETMVRAAILVIDAGRFAEAAAHADSHELFRFMGQSLEVMTEAVEKEHGIIGCFTDVGMTVFFPRGQECAVAAAAQALKGLAVLPPCLGGVPVHFGAGVVTGVIRLGVIGTEERMEVTALSGDSGLAGVLEDMSCRYHCGVLMDGEDDQVQKGADRSKGLRMFGYVSFHKEDRPRLIYEDYSGCTEEQARLRDLTREDFERGICLIRENRYEEARACFIRVLKANQDDRAAGRYFRFCDTCMQDEKGWHGQPL